jgi:hypothetical protein
MKGRYTVRYIKQGKIIRHKKEYSKLGNAINFARKLVLANSFIGYAQVIKSKRRVIARI